MQFANIMKSFDRMARLNNNFHIKDRSDDLMIAEVIEDIPYLSFKERHLFALAPLNVRRIRKRSTLKQLKKTQEGSFNSLLMFYGLIK